MPPRKTVLGFGSLEQAVMDALWQAGPGRWLTLGAVRELMNRAYPNTHIPPTLASLCAKGHVQRRRAVEGSHWVYQATRSQGDFLAGQILAVLAYSGDPAAVLERARRELAAATAPGPPLAFP